MKRKRYGVIFLTSLIVFILVAVIAHKYVIDKVEEKISSEAEKINLTYDAIQVNLFSGNIVLETAQLFLQGKTDTNHKLSCDIKCIELKGFDFTDYLFHKNIKLKRVNLLKPSVLYNLQDSSEIGNLMNYFKNRTHQDLDIEIDVFQIENADLKAFKSARDSIIFQVDSIDLEVLDISKKRKKGTNPFKYGSLSLNANNLFYDLGTFEKITVASLQTDLNRATCVGVSMETKFSREAFSARLEKERDWYQVSVDSIVINGMNTSNRKSILHTAVDSVGIYVPKIDIYRDKLLPDNFEYKPLYSELIRDMSHKFSINQTSIYNGKVFYEEKLNNTSEKAELKFFNLNGHIKNLGNYYMPKDSIGTHLYFTSDFMDKTPVEIDWNFNVNDPEDKFMFKAKIGQVAATDFNQFIEPKMNLKLEGELRKMYFTIDGTNYSSNINLKINYNNFKVTVFRRNGREKNKLLSGLANLFLKKTSRNEDDNFREASKEGIKREQDKSFFSFLWLSVREGLINAMIGDSG